MLYVIVEGKKATKKRSEKSRKFKIFAKGLVRGVGPKWAIFPSLHEKLDLLTFTHEQI